MHGAPAYGRYPTGGPQKQWPEGISGRPRQPKRLSAGAGQEVLVGFACPDAKRPRKRLHGAQRRRAPNATHSVVWGTSVRQTIQIIAYFSHRSNMRKLVPRRSAPNVTHTDISGTKRSKTNIRLARRKAKPIDFSIPQRNHQMKILKKH